MAAKRTMAVKMLPKEIPGNNDTEDISKGFETVPVTVEKSATIMSDFEYVAHVICGPEISINFDQSMYPGCNCVDNCNESSCPCLLRYGPNYDNHGHLLKAENKAGYCLPVFECNGSCSCSANCSNRLSQQSIKIKLQVFQTNNRGLGVRTLQSIHKDRYTCEYSGEIISYGEAKRRSTKIGQCDKNYLFVLKEHVADGKVLRTHIDASTYGNVARFMNHSCDPNMFILPVRVNCPVPRLCLFALRDIEVGEELTFSYGDIMNKDERNSTGQDTSCFSNTARTECLCGSSNCAGYLPFDQCLYDS